MIDAFKRLVEWCKEQTTDVKYEVKTLPVSSKSDEIVASFINFDFEGERKRREEERATKRLEIGRNFDDGYSEPGTECEWFGCYEERWVHPDKGRLATCCIHTLDYINGGNAPPLRRNIDYHSVARKPLVIDWSPQDDKDAK